MPWHSAKLDYNNLYDTFGKKVLEIYVEFVKGLREFYPPLAGFFALIGKNRNSAQSSRERSLSRVRIEQEGEK